jgi:arylsulfatase A-like enzyme
MIHEEEINLLDDGIGRIIEELKRQDLYDNSLIIFTSDHGEMLGSYRLRQKFCMY